MVKPLKTEMISYRKLKSTELKMLSQIDRSEVIRVGYEVSEGKLVRKKVKWDAPNFFQSGDGEHSVSKQIEFCNGHLARNAISIGAFDENCLVGIGLLTPNIRSEMAQLAYLQVSRSHRRRRIASEITQQLLQEARSQRARYVYVSATPSESAVGFYQSFGFEVIEEPLPELYELEPEDVHMILELEPTM